MGFSLISVLFVKYYVANFEFLNFFFLGFNVADVDKFYQQCDPGAYFFFFYFFLYFCFSKPKKKKFFNIM